MGCGKICAINKTKTRNQPNTCKVNRECRECRHCKFACETAQGCYKEKECQGGIKHVH